MGDYFRSQAPELKDLRDQLAKSHKELDDLNDEIPSTLVMVFRNAMSRGNPRMCSSGEIF